jgi:hypothetical protein
LYLRATDDASAPRGGHGRKPETPTRQSPSVQWLQSIRQSEWVGQGYMLAFLACSFILECAQQRRVIAATTHAQRAGRLFQSVSQAPLGTRRSVRPRCKCSTSATLRHTSMHNSVDNMHDIANETATRMHVRLDHRSQYVSSTQQTLAKKYDLAHRRAPEEAVTESTSRRNTPDLALAGEQMATHHRVLHGIPSPAPHLAVDEVITCCLLCGSMQRHIAATHQAPQRRTRAQQLIKMPPPAPVVPADDLPQSWLPRS